MKINKISSICAVMAAAVVFSGAINAATPGSYLGLGLGVSLIDTPESQAFNLDGAASGMSSYDRAGLGGRAFVGFNWNKYFGAEAGYSQYARSKYNGTYDALSSSLRYTAYTIDAVGKGYLPLGGSGFNLYALLGAAFVNSTVKFNNGGVPTNFVAPQDGTTTLYRIRPKFGLGVMYDFASKPITLSLEDSVVYGKGNVATNPSAIPNLAMLTFNVAYKFN